MVNSKAMISSYFKIAFRNLWRHRIFSLINILGLATGMTACFLIYLYVHFELSYDSFHSKADRIYRIVADIKMPSGVIDDDGPAWAVPPHMKSEFPQVADFVRISSWENISVRKDDKRFVEKSINWADSAFFEVFDFRLLKGDPHTALKEPYSIVLSETAAKKYFGNEEPLGQTLLLADDDLAVKVTGVMKDIPENSQIKASLILSMSTMTSQPDAGLDNNWSGYGAFAYLLLKPGTDAKALEQQLPAFLEKRNGGEMKQLQMYPTLILEPLREVYLWSTREGQQKGNIVNVYIFSVIAVFILLIAGFNFINLSTARSADRAREVGIRKAVGAERWQLIRQFTGESMIICGIAFLLAIVFSSMLLPMFNQLAGKTISQSIFGDPRHVLTLFLATAVLGVLTGIYPALVLSSFKPVTVLKGRLPAGGSALLLRKALVVSQFAISTALIIATIIVYNQMRYMRTRNLGFNKDQILVMDTYGDPAKNAFKQALAGIPGVKSVAMSGSVPGSGHSSAHSEIEGQHGDFQTAALNLYFVDFDYLRQFGIAIIAGRGLSREFSTDSTKAMLLNEAAVKMLGFASPQQAIGKRFRQWGAEGTVIGVIKDFHFHALQQPIKPLSMRFNPEYFHLVSVNIAPENRPATIAAIEKMWKKMIPSRPFNYYFMDEYFNRQYHSEEQFGKLVLNFAILAVFISCLGLLGLAAYATMQRTREIGIRKVLGASVPDIVGLLSRDFLRLVAIAAVIAFPLAWFVMNRWLQDFAYRTGVSWWVFVVAGMLAAFIALFTICSQAVRAAVANPVKSLKVE